MDTFQNSCFHFLSLWPWHFFSNKSKMCYSFWGSPAWVLTQGQQKPSSKLKPKHVMFQQWLNVCFNLLEASCPKTCYQRPEIRNIPPFETFQVSMGGPAQVSMLRQLKIWNILPIKTCKVSGAMFWCHAHLLHAKPIHNALDIFPLSHVSSNFCQSILLRKLMQVMK